MLILGVALGLILGLLVGGKIENLVSVRLRWMGLLFLAAGVRFLAEYLLGQGNTIVVQLRLPILGLAYSLLLVTLYINRRQPGMAMAFVGILGNAVPILANGGYMPIWEPSLVAAGFVPGEVASPLHVIVPAPLDAEFLWHFGFLGDIIPIPVPVLRNVASIGDVFLSVGLGFFLFATVVRTPEEALADRELIPSSGRTPWVPVWRRRITAVYDDSGDTGDSGLTPALAKAAALERPLGLGGSSAGLSSPSISSVPLAFETAAARARRALPPAIPVIPVLIERARRHPYVRLALNGSFSALWVGQLISLFGDRLHQIALAFLVLVATNSPVAVGLVFLAATLPNLVLGPIAGTFVDRLNQKQVMVVSDLLRALAVLLVPVAASANLILVYPLVFIVTSVSIFFRPARTAVIPRIVARDELLAANSATWIAETLADVIGYPIAGLFVAFLGAALPLAFWLDAATYVASAVMIGTMVIPPLRRVTVETDQVPARAPAATPASATVAAAAGLAPASVAATALPPSGTSVVTPTTAATVEIAPQPGDEFGAASPLQETGVDEFIGEMKAGWHFLRGDTVLLANTIQGAIGQFTIGVLLTLLPFYARDVIQRGSLDATSTYAFLETGTGVGNLLGGFLIGLVGTRLAKGRMVIAGYVLWGLFTVGLALAGQVGLALGMTVGMGVANMIFVIPSQTLFQERVPADLIGRVVSFRFSLVFGSMTLAMAVSGVLALGFGVPAVMGFFGLVTVLTGLGGLLVRQVRDA